MISWITSARCLISCGVRTPLIMSILTSGMVEYLLDGGRWYVVSSDDRSD